MAAEEEKSDITFPVVYQADLAKNEYPAAIIEQITTSKEGSKNLAAKYATGDIWKQYADKKTKIGFQFRDAINTGLKNPTSYVGCHFGDLESYTLFKEFYDNASFLQTGAMTVAAQKAKAPEFGEAKSGAGGAIISILEMSNEDFVKLHSETEANEAEAVEQFEKLMNDNSASKGAKQAEVKASLSEIKSLTVALENTGEDHSMTSQELAAVMEYLEKLKPQCEEKVMSYAEKKARREAEIAGLKEALEILAGGLALVQEGNLRTAQLHA